MLVDVNERQIQLILQMLNCKLCNKKIDERNAQEQCGFTLCHSCVDTNTDYELRELLWSSEVLEGESK